MIKILYQLLDKLSVSDIVCEKDISPLLEQKINRIEVTDARSAAFKAFGLAKMKDSRVALIVDERYISSIYTAITESWFHKTNILIITINGNLYQSLEYLDRCTTGKMLLLDNTDQKVVADEIIRNKGPFLLRTAISLETAFKVDYSTIEPKLSKVLKDGDLLSLYNPSEVYPEIQAKICIIHPEHKYCVISKYIGNLLGEENSKHIICIPESLLGYDSNIYNFRSIPDNFCVVVLADASNLIQKMESWISTNSISFNTTDISHFTLSGMKEIVYVKN